MQRSTISVWTAVSRALGVALFIVGVVCVQQATCSAQDSDKLTEKDLKTILKFFDDDKVVAKIESAGVAFEVNAAALERLNEAGATDAVLTAVKNAAPSPQPANVVTFIEVVNLLEAGVSNAEIIGLLEEKSPTGFVLGVDQVQKLSRLGASDELIAAMKDPRKRTGGKNGEETKISDLALILDCSGSMAEKTSDGSVKMTVAKRVVSDLLEGLPEGLYLTLLIYGHDKQLGCESVEVARSLQPLAGPDKPELVEYVNALRPASKTPIALSLRTAYQELAQRDKQCGLILISDGKETCKGDPQAEAARLANNLNCQFGVNVVGFDVDEEGQQQLQEVASAGRGEYVNASNAAELADRVSGLAEKVEEAAVVPAVNRKESLVSAIKVKQLNLKGLPKMAEVRVFPHEDKQYAYDQDFEGILEYKSLQSSQDFGKPIIVGGGTYDVFYKPARKEANWVRIYDDLEVKSNETVELNANELAAAVVMPDPGIEGIDDFEWVRIFPAGTERTYTEEWGYVQRCTEFGTPMMVDPGRSYDVWLKPRGGTPVPVAKDVQPSAGQVTVIGKGNQDPQAGAFAGAEAESD